MIEYTKPIALPSEEQPPLTVIQSQVFFVYVFYFPKNPLSYLICAGTPSEKRGKGHLRICHSLVVRAVVGIRCMFEPKRSEKNIVTCFPACATANPEVGYQTWIQHLSFCVAGLCLASGVVILLFWLLRVLALIFEFQTASNRRSVPSYSPWSRQ